MLSLTHCKCTHASVTPYIPWFLVSDVVFIGFLVDRWNIHATVPVLNTPGAATILGSIHSSHALSCDLLVTRIRTTQLFPKVSLHLQLAWKKIPLKQFCSEFPGALRLLIRTYHSQNTSHVHCISSQAITTTCTA